MVLRFEFAELGVGRRAERLAARARPPVVDGDDDVAQVGQGLVPEEIAAFPTVHDRLRTRPAVHEHQHRVLFGRVEGGGFDHPAVQRHAFGGRELEKFRFLGAILGEFLEEFLIRFQRPDHRRCGGLAQRHRRHGLHGTVVLEVVLEIGAEQDAVDAALVGKPHRSGGLVALAAAFGGGNVLAVEVAFERRDIGGGVVYRLGGFVEAQKFGHFPAAGS